ncbi:DUF3800 domain-containing protein [Paenibacillus luteus]|uniref:DUF3800 domain-containing protein n=1 Tax=Paenibacillus luteus TaxID=2545753 RepID=UPI0011434DD9|nr:DUF3800 domain-containing protein [Paenibacillus luteus]
MKDFFVYIDDSGSPGQPPANKFLAPDTKIWAAVILSLEEKNYIDSVIDLAIKKLQQEIPFSEFHFTEIYSAKNAFQGIDSKLRLEIVQLFVELYNSIKPYVVVIATGSGTLKNSGFSQSYKSKKENGFSFSDPSEYALNTLLLIINEYMIENYKEENIKAEIIIDEGRQKANTIQLLTDFIGIFNELNYKSSKNVYGLQFVDFIAFSINRIQNNISKNRAKFDNEFMRIIGTLQLNSNLKTISVTDLDEVNKDAVESFLESQESPSIGAIQYVEELSNCLSRIRDFILKKNTAENKEIILQDIKRLKQFSSISNEFAKFLDTTERLISDQH